MDSSISEHSDIEKSRLRDYKNLGELRREERTESREAGKSESQQAELKLLLLPRLRVDSNIIGKANIAEHFGKFDILSEESRLS